MIKKKKEVDVENLNGLILLGKKILKVLYVAIVLAVVLLGIVVLSRLKIGKIVLGVLSVLSPLFIGLVVAWLLDPIVNYLSKKNVKRGLGTVIVFAGFLLIVFLIFKFMVPMLYRQLNDFINTLPHLFTTLTQFARDAFEKLNSTGFDFSGVERKVYDALSTTATNLTESLSTNIINGLSSFFSSVWSIVLGFIIGFYLLIDFNRMQKLYDIVPKKYRKTFKKLMYDLDSTFKDFVQGTLVISVIMSIIAAILFAIIGLPSPLLFGLIVGFTNIIPYIGPWMGGGIAAIVGFTVSPLVGILTLVMVVIVQQIDGIVLKPLIMSRAMKLHPVTIVVSLLVFGYFFGILGMVLATPLTAGLKVILMYLNDRYKWLDKLFAEEEEETV